MSKQTAVEYLVEQLTPKSPTSEQYYHIVKAKTMEKEQIISAVDYGTSDWGSYKDPEVYYNETYNNKTKHENGI
jgi:hypothetical protein